MKSYNIVPVPKPRMTVADRWKKRPAVIKYWEFKDAIKELGLIFKNGDSITFIIPMPKSWSAKKCLSMDGKPHQQKPDIDNLYKALSDSIFEEDSSIWHLGEQMKLWGRKGKIIINSPLDKKKN